MKPAILTSLELEIIRLQSLVNCCRFLTEDERETLNLTDRYNMWLEKLEKLKLTQEKRPDD